MTPGRRDHIERLALEALARDPSSRAAYLDEACAGDAALRHEVDSLIAGPAQASGFLETPVWRATWTPLLPGTRLGPYEIEATIGAGGMGEVYKARDTRLRRDVAVKALPQAFAQDHERLRRFQVEAQAVAALNHPNILAIHDIGSSPAMPAAAAGTDSATAGAPVHYLVTELLEGETLRQRIARGPLAVASALSIALPIVRALAAAHDKHIVHRDLKPSNVFLTADDQVKLLDFGVAKVLGPGGAGMSDPAVSGDLTGEPHALLGTVGYMSPEQADGLAIDARSDIFSFGAVLYEMLTGRRVFEGATAAAVLSAIRTKEAPPLADACRDAPAALRSVVSRCLAKRPEDRFQSAHDVALALEAVSTRTAGPRRVHRVLLPAAILLLLVAAGGALYLRHYRWNIAAPAAGAEVPKHARSAIAVLPLQNRSADPANTYFAGGLHDELITQLSKVAGLKVIGRTSVMGYHGVTKPLMQIGDELGVGTLVEGSVQVADGRLRVSVNLVDTATSRLLWSDRYDRTLDDTFAIQSDVAQRIAAGVGVALSSDEQARVTANPTANAEAYRLYLQGQEYLNRPGMLRTNLNAAAQLHERALELDPGFALAHAGLSRVHGNIYWFRYDPSPSRATRQREEAESALRLAPDLPQAHVAMGLAHYFGRLNYREALNEFEIARATLPNDAELWASIGFANRRLGNWKAVAAAYDRATLVDPRNAETFYDLGGETFTLLHRYADAVGAYDRALRLAPDMYPAAFRRALVFILWKGQLDPMRDVLAGLPEGAALGAHASLAAQRAALLLLERDADGLLEMLEVLRGTDFDGHVFFLPSALYRAWAFRLRGDQAAARAAFESAAERLDGALHGLPNDWRIHAARGLALAGLGRCDQAIAEARWLRQSNVYRGDAHFGTIAAEGRAQILAQCGNADAALDEIKRLLPGPSWLSVHTLRLDPRWDPIRADARFQALLKVHGS